MTEPAPVTRSDHQPSDQLQKPRTARFGVFEVDLRSGELRRSGVRVKLQEQPFRILAMLLERPGEVVSRDELRERLWPTEFVDFDHSLNTAVRKLRTALDDAAENPRFIETLARRGYRFIAPVVWEGAAAAAAAVAAAPVPAPASRKLPIIPASVALLVVAAIAAWLIVRNPFRPSVPTVNAIAVLPLANSDPNSQHVSDGLTEILIDTLSHLNDLRVMGRSTVFRYRADTDPRTVGKDLNVGAVITGRVQPENGGYRIHVELIDARDGSQLWGNQYRSAASELAGTQSRISNDLAVELRRGLDREQRQLLFRRYTRSAEAYDLYLQGLYAWNKRSTADLQKAIELFTRATELDPQFAAPWSGIANTYGVMVGYGILDPSVGTPKIFAAARRALELDPYNGEAYVSMATTEYRNEWDFAAAERDYKRGLTLNPNYATGHQWYSDFLRSMGKFDEAQREIETAARLDPLSGPINSVVCWSLVNNRRYREAIAFYEKSKNFNRRNAAAQCAASAYFLLGDYDTAVAMIPAIPHRAEIVEAYEKGGMRALMLRRIEQLEKTQDERNRDTEIAAQYSMLGMNDKAFDRLEKAYRQRLSALTNLNIDPRFDPLRSDPRFDDLLRRIGLPKVTPPGPLQKPVPSGVRRP